MAVLMFWPRLQDHVASAHFTTKYPSLCVTIISRMQGYGQELPNSTARVTLHGDRLTSVSTTCDNRNIYQSNAHFSSKISQLKKLKIALVSCPLPRQLFPIKTLHSPPFPLPLAGPSYINSRN
jgi:hypothetical protein